MECYHTGPGDVLPCNKCVSGAAGNHSSYPFGNASAAAGMLEKIMSSGVGVNGTDAADSAFNFTAPLTHAKAAHNPFGDCHRENSILYILLMFGTLWLGLFLYNFRKT